MSSNLDMDMDMDMSHVQFVEKTSESKDDSRLDPPTIKEYLLSMC